VDASFRVTGKNAGVVARGDGNRSRRRSGLRMAAPRCRCTWKPWGFGVSWSFRKATTETSHTLPATAEAELAAVNGSWKVSFQPGRGAPPSITLRKLASWTDSSDAGVKVFLWNGHLHHDTRHQADWFKKGCIFGWIWAMSRTWPRLTVNGKSLGIVWHAPYRVDATGALKPGTNVVQSGLCN